MTVEVFNREKKIYSTIFPKYISQVYISKQIFKNINIFVLFSLFLIHKHDFHPSHLRKSIDVKLFFKKIMRLFFVH